MSNLPPAARARTIAKATAGVVFVTALGLAPVAVAHPAGSSIVGHDSAGHATTTKGHVASSARINQEVSLRLAMRGLWAQHMEWTYAAIAAFVDGSAGFDATVARLLQNQAHIGDAIKPFYGKAAGNTLTALLTEHITDAVPVLTAAKAGDTTALNAAVADWYDNADRIAAFLSKANPKSWKAKEMRSMMRMHITQTVAYASDMLSGDRAKAIRDYEVAEHHMQEMADMLTDGLIAQFPKKF